MVTSHVDDSVAAAGGEEALVANIMITFLAEELGLLQDSLGFG